jgi:hypothetical protein
MRVQSFSSMNTYATCPKQYKLTYVTPVIPYQETDATRYGTEVHLALEEYCRDSKPLSETHKRFKPYGDKIISLEGDKFYEQEMALNKNLQPVEFSSPDAWVRGIIDVLVVRGDKAIVNDWKTGKVKPDSDQLKLFAGFVMHHYPEVNTVKTVYSWIVHHKTTVETYHREDLPAIWDHFNVKMAKIEASYEKDRWTPKTSGLCNGWCGATKEHCDFWKPRRS